ncbi:MAG: FecR family protein [Chitinophagaceae bacterium]|nr:MAG: FecR family protein [Chitinophagaceae bacterium]
MENNAERLLKKYLAGQCTTEEKAVVEDWYLQFPSQRDIPNHKLIESSKKEVFNRLNFRAKSTSLVILKQIAVAASILLCIGLAIRSFNRQTSTTPSLVKKELKDVLPGSDRAVLTLADGRVIDLDKAKVGEIARQNGIITRKLENGQLEYFIQDPTVAAMGMHTIATPRGGQYQVNLPDGTKVWLNAASSLKYPYIFAKDERLVQLNGEAYFEVAKDKHRPFKVQTNQQTIEVLGTHFNVNAYADEPELKTTLLEGAIKVNVADKQIRLKPGEQSKLVTNTDQLSIDRNIDPNQFVAWKNDIFSFNNDDLKTVMRQISRWYDIDVRYDGKITHEKYFGEIPRNTNLSEVFEILELNHIKVEITGKTMTIIGN